MSPASTSGADGLAGSTDIRPTTSYFICATPRSGSNLLSGLLAETGIAGRPREYFSNEEAWPERWQVSGADEYLRAAVAAGTTDNGVWGVKAFWRHMAESLFEKLQAVDGRNLGELELLEARFPNPRFIWLTRRDEVAQAVSFARGIQTKQWVHSLTPRCEPEFRFLQIPRRLFWIRKGNDWWREWFEANGIEPFKITYEELVEDMEGVTRAVLDFLGIELPGEVRIRPRHQKQADGINADWIARYTEIVEIIQPWPAGANGED